MQISARNTDHSVVNCTVCVIKTFLMILLLELPDTVLF